MLTGHAHSEHPAESLQKQPSDPDRWSAAVVGSVVDVDNDDHQQNGHCEVGNHGSEELL